MASVMKMFHNFKSSHLPRGKRSQTISAPAPASPKDQTREDPEGAPSSDLVNRRKVSISRSGRYRENHKKRCALPDDTRSSSDDLASPKVVTRADTTTKDQKNKENEKSRANEKNRENLVRRESAISVTDGHAVADEIESLAKKMTIENALQTSL
ncbi:uncharacterized protein LOC122246678 [Penaeus japonicus]|uniref:uncharacterized protein LOC122246678 n=1 Tax=Penaeus japonicus TaxID=27405 RepID=UPI001C70C1BA|nr:uncharacterized protein LOC122246678 [Penaeus japonicus]